MAASSSDVIAAVGGCIGLLKWAPGCSSAAHPPVHLPALPPALTCCPFPACCQEMDGLDGEESSTTRCLQDYIEEISNPQCRDMVQRYKQLAAEDIRFDVPLADACASDRKSLCANIPPVRIAACQLHACRMP